MRKLDPYEILGIDRGATHEEAKRRFRILALQFHPDRNPGDPSAEARFKEVEDAWSQLEHVLPKSGVPLEIPEGASEAEIEAAYVKWLLDPRNSAPAEPGAHASPKRRTDEPRVWSTVAGEGVPVVYKPDRRRDWRRVTIRRFRPAHGLERISSEQAARLLDSHPNAFAVLKIVQQQAPRFCLYDAILWRAHAARAMHQDSSARELVIVGADAVDQTSCQEALRNPIASVEMAEEDLALIAPQVKFGGAVMARQKLALDLHFLKEEIIVLSARLRGHAR